MYFQDTVTERYPHAADPPRRDRIVFTIDHIHLGGAGRYSTQGVVRHLVSRQIPVTVFVQCTDPANRCPADRRHALSIHQLNPGLVSLGGHSLSPGNSQTEQADNLDLIKSLIRDVTGRTPQIMSYHGSGAGPEPGISYAGIVYARGIGSQWSAAQHDDPLNTPVMGLGTVQSAFEYIRLRNLAGLSATLFVHSAELINGSMRKRVFDTLIQSVVEGHLQAVDYETAMRQDYAGGTPTPAPTPIPQPTPPVDDCPLRHFSNRMLVQHLAKPARDGVNGISQVAQLQRFLNELGLDAGVVDGIFGNNTKLAVIGFQISRGLVSDGVVGANTRASINSYCD